MEKESEIQLLEALDQLEVCFSECVSQFFSYASGCVIILIQCTCQMRTTSLLKNFFILT